MSYLERKKVLVIDDEQQMCQLIGTVLKKAGASVVTAANGRDGLRLLYETKPDLVILDVLMPQVDGWKTLDQIRQLTDTPVIMLTVLEPDQHEVRALNAGASDYIRKPFEPTVLVARAEAAIRESGVRTAPGIYVDDYLYFDRYRRRVTVDGESVRLTRKEFDLLSHLILHRNRVCTYQNILEYVWGGTEQGSAENVHVFICQLRQKIEPDRQNPIYIRNELGVGYTFVNRAQA